MKFTLPKLPYEFDALEPYISARTLEFHYSKHHQGYMTKLEKAIGDKELGEQSLEYIVCNSDGAVFNNAAQVWNHTFYWNGMAPSEGKTPTRQFLERLNRDLGGLEKFKREFAEIASSQFGSGWAWLVQSRDGDLEIVSTGDAENPMTDGATPLLTLDVWEHAYYLDYQNDRGAYIEAFLDHLIDWRFVERNSMASADQDAAVGAA